MAAKLKPGDQVVIVKCYESKLPKYKGKVFTVRSEPWRVSGQDVVLLDGLAGGWATKFLKKVAS